MAKLRQIINGPLKEPLDDFALLVLRVGFGATMLFQHGLGKLQKFSLLSATFPDPLNLGGGAYSLMLVLAAEVLCAGLVAFGLFTRFAALPLIITMGVAFFVIHGDDPFEKKELALTYGLAFTAILLKGGGSYSLDQYFFGKG